ncbi:hypothetical protein [Roseovarius spongiae]|nr:hypothetical protein [Roseovarius spongiae]
MNAAPPPLAGYARNVHSQFGEDGVIAEILKRLEIDGEDRPKWCVEFGAWDGKHLSNTYNLIANHDWRAVLIEGDRTRYEELCRNIPSDDVVKVCQFVHFEGENSLDAILGRTDIPEDFDLLSVDVDGCDYHIWDSLKRFRPKIVVVELNPSIPVEVAYIQPRDFSVKHGNGVRALDDLAKDKGYTTVAVTLTNLIAVRDDLAGKVLGDERPTLPELVGESGRQVFFVAFDGTVMCTSEGRLHNWHYLPLSVDDLQIIPRYLRTFPEDFSPMQKAAFHVFRPWWLFRRALRKLTY